MSYRSLGFDDVRKAIGNVDKMSANNKSHTANTPFGVIRYIGTRWAWGKVSRQYSVSGSSVLHNGGGWTIRGIKMRIG